MVINKFNSVSVFLLVCPCTWMCTYVYPCRILGVFLHQCLPYYPEINPLRHVGATNCFSKAGSLLFSGLCPTGRSQADAVFTRALGGLNSGSHDCRANPVTHGAISPDLASTLPTGSSGLVCCVEWWASPEQPRPAFLYRSFNVYKLQDRCSLFYLTNN